ncbi:MAG: TonB family protein, partial [Acidobacteriota bacterium]|nr:TonB family protein [Acidobacteriota bacterium]
MSTVPQNSSRPEYAASAPARPANAPAAQRRSSGGGNLAKRDDNSGRKLGPDGPDDDERPKPTANASDDTAPTFTLTTVAAASTTVATSSPASSPAPTTSEPSPTSGSTNLFSAANTPATSTNSPTAAPTPQPSNRPTPADSHTATEASEQKPATSGQKASASEQKAEARPKMPASGGVLNGKALSLPRPVYPASARNAGASGKVVVEVTINEEGKVVEAHAVSGHPMLQQAAVQAARLAKFSPAMLSGQPVKVTGTISYTFSWQ